MKDPTDKATIDVFSAHIPKPRGGKREGAGVKRKYGEPTVTLRVPVSCREPLALWLEALETVEKYRRNGDMEKAEHFATVLQQSVNLLSLNLAIFEKASENETGLRRRE
jgi:hypothetical protein